MVPQIPDTKQSMRDSGGRGRKKGSIPFVPPLPLLVAPDPRNRLKMLLKINENCCRFWGTHSLDSLLEFVEIPSVR
jgi:hypothetical protein